MTSLFSIHSLGVPRLTRSSSYHERGIYMSTETSSFQNFISLFLHLKSFVRGHPLHLYGNALVFKAGERRQAWPFTDKKEKIDQENDEKVEQESGRTGGGGVGMEAMHGGFFYWAEKATLRVGRWQHFLKRKGPWPSGKSGHLPWNISWRRKFSDSLKNVCGRGQVGITVSEPDLWAFS